MSETGPARPLYEMLAYHLGLDPNAPQQGGKRIRPLLGLLAYQSLGGDYKKALPGAAALELGHNFSLVHDDIEDADRERRHRPTLWALWGIPAAINAGDALFALSRLALYRLLEGEEYEIARPRPDEDLRRDVPGALRGAVSRHQLRAPRRRDRRGLLRDDRQEDRGTARRSVMAGAILAVDDTEVHEAYRQFGHDLGMAFQMADDIKGTFWRSEESGKPEAGTSASGRRRCRWSGRSRTLAGGSCAPREIYAPPESTTDGRPAI